jgi:hypothetical protein
MARLYVGPLGSAEELKVEEDLPGLSGLPAAQRVQLGLAQADTALAHLKAFLGDNVPLPTTAAVRTQTEQDPPDRDAIRKKILDLHVALLVQLTAADYRLGKAYSLGRALADTCASARGNDTERGQALAHHLDPYRASVIIGWLDDLKSLLPAHAAQSVADSFGYWKQWAETANVTKLDSAGADETTAVLHRCGQRWRAILSGEKDATDMLEIADYVTAARGTLARAASIAWSLALRLWAPLGLAAALMGIGIWLMIADNGAAQVLAGLGTVAGGLGVTWRSAAGSLGHFSLDLVKPLWDAQVDLAVATRLTPAPQRELPSPAANGRRRRLLGSARRV